MQSLSVVIICKNEADVIGKTLQSLEGLCNDIIIYDNGSTDETTEIVKRFNAQLHRGTWDGFGKTKNKATALAKYDWILSLDADEAIDEKLKQSLLNLTLDDEKKIYSITRKNFLGSQCLKFGEWGSDKQSRLFNRRQVSWNDALVHEKLIMPAGVTIQNLEGCLLHSTMKDIADYAEKTTRYALLNAKKYQAQGKRASWFRLRIAPAFAFFKSYILKLGFLDGHAGYVCAKMTACYTFLKYARLKELNKVKTDN